MDSYNRSNERRSSQRRAQAQQKRRSKRSVGATAISASGARALGLSSRDKQRSYGRGETARRVEAAHHAQDERADSINARPAVYTGEAKRKGLLSRFRLPSFGLSADAIPVIPLPVLILIGLAIALAIIAVPARMYYAAWRDAGVLEAEYAAIDAQNEELNHQIDRLQTVDGIEDEARQRGYVYPNEEALVVDGATPQQTADPSQVEAAVREYEQGLPWYVGILDFIFGYQHS